MLSLFQIHYSLSEEQIWVWQWGDSELFMDLDEEIRFKVSKESFVETMPVVREPGAGQDAPAVTVIRQSPYSIVVGHHESSFFRLMWSLFFLSLSFILHCRARSTLMGWAWCHGGSQKNDE